MENRVGELERELERLKTLHSFRYQQWTDHVRDLEEQVQHLQLDNRRLCGENAEYERKPGEVSHSHVDREQTKPWFKGDLVAESEHVLCPVEELSCDQIERYSRQLLLKDGFGIEGQRKMLSSSVLVIGAGGIGSTVLLYLAAAGVGKISVVDFDGVEISNLHRQVIHKEENVGVNKAKSACRAVRDLNSTIKCVPVQESLTHENALELVSRHDCVVDATDNPLSRYLINDACVLADKPLVSGSAMGTEGQLTVYNHEGSPCYRCLYPKPNQREGCKSCSDNGVLGPVPGLIGILQALEVIKVLTGVGSTMHDRMLMYDSLQCDFMRIKKPPKQKNCPVCGPDATIRSMEDSHERSQSVRGPIAVAVEGGKRISLHVPPELPEEFNVSCIEYDQIRKRGDPHVLLDVRVKRQFDMCSLDGAVNIPLDELKGEIGQIKLRDIAELANSGDGGLLPIYCICRRGIFSVEATRLISSNSGLCACVKNIRGGLECWTKEVDKSFPKY